MSVAGVLKVRVSCVRYPVTKDVLRQVFHPYGASSEMLVFERRACDLYYVEAYVHFRSLHEAEQARDALNGRNIYDGCCSLAIDHASPACSTAAVPEIQDKGSLTGIRGHDKAALASSNRLQVAPESDLTKAASNNVVPVVLAPSSTLEDAQVIDSSTSITSAITMKKGEKTLMEMLAEINAILDRMLAMPDVSPPPSSTTEEGSPVTNTLNAGSDFESNSHDKCLTVGLNPHAGANYVTEVPLAVEADQQIIPSPADASHIPKFPSFFVLQLGIVVPNNPTIRSEDDMIMQSPNLEPRNILSIKHNGQNLRPAPWPSFINGMVNYLLRPPRLSFKVGNGGQFSSWATKKLSQYYSSIEPKGTTLATQESPFLQLMGNLSSSIGYAIVKDQCEMSVELYLSLFCVVKKWGQDTQCVQPTSVLRDDPLVWHEHHIVGIPSRVVASASVLESQERELCMRYISADCDGISRVQLTRQPWLPPMLEVVHYHMKGVACCSKHIAEIVLWTCSRHEPLWGKCCTTCICGNHSIQGILVKWRFRLRSAKGKGMIWSVASLLNYHGKVVHTDCQMTGRSKYKMEEQQKLGGGLYSYHLSKFGGGHISSSTLVHTGFFRQTDSFVKSMCLVAVLTHQLGVRCCLVVDQIWKLRGTKHMGDDTALVLGHEQNPTVFVVTPKLVLSLQRLDHLTVLESQCVCWIDLMPDVSRVEVLDAREKWDPDGSLSNMSGEHKTNHTERSRRLQRFGAQGYKLIIGMDDPSAPWDPGIIAIYESAVPFVPRPGELYTTVGATNYGDLCMPLFGDKQCFAGAVV
jgi:hypothetical protein